MKSLEIPVALGTDSVCCNGRLNAFESMKWALLMQNLAFPHMTNWFTAEDVLEMATRNSARALTRTVSVVNFNPAWKLISWYLKRAGLAHSREEHSQSDCDCRFSDRGRPGICAWQAGIQPGAAGFSG